MTGVRLLSVAPDDSTVHGYVAVDDTVYPIASYTHLLAPDNIVIEYKGPLVAALYQDKPLSKRQQALVRTTLQKMPHTLHDYRLVQAHSGHD